MDSTRLEKFFKHFSDEAKLSENFLRVENHILEIISQIFCLLEKFSKFKIDRKTISGSIGKKSAVGENTDYDLVIFVNNQRPFFKKVLRDFEYILRTKSDMVVQNIKVTDFSIQFDVNGITVDLLPATNFVTETPQPRGKDLAKLQAKRTIEFIRSNPGFGYNYGSAVCELQMQFLKDQTPFVHQVVHLAKFWNKTLNMGTYIPGRSTMIELIGVEAGKTQEAKGQRSCLEAFKVFLTLMSEFDRLCVKNCSYNLCHIPCEVEYFRPLVMDPVNPYNNFAYFEGMDHVGIIRKFKEFADVTIMRLKDSRDISQLFQFPPK